MRTELYYNEQVDYNIALEALQASPEALQEFIEPVFNSDKKYVQNWKRKEYLQHFYKENKSVNQTAARRYWAKPQVLGWDIFDLEKEATKANQHETYENYTLYVYNNVNHLTVAKIVLKLAYCFLTPEQVEAKQLNNQWNEWLYDIKTWYANSFVFTVWFGKHKEHYALPYMVDEAAKYGLKVFKTSAEKDMKYMIDYVALEWDTLTNNWKPIFGISVKGLSWFYANNNGNSSYQSKGEVREKRGHESFTTEYKAPVIIVVSDPESGNGSIRIVSTMRETLQKLEAEGVITKCLAK